MKTNDRTLRTTWIPLLLILYTIVTTGCRISPKDEFTHSGKEIRIRESPSEPERNYRERYFEGRIGQRTFSARNSNWITNPAADPENRYFVEAGAWVTEHIEHGNNTHTLVFEGAATGDDDDRLILLKSPLKLTFRQPLPDGLIPKVAPADIYFVPDGRIYEVFVYYEPTKIVRKSDRVVEVHREGVPPLTLDVNASLKHHGISLEELTALKENEAERQDTDSGFFFVLEPGVFLPLDGGGSGSGRPRVTRP